MYINNVKIYGLEESMIAAGYPMRSDIDENTSIDEDIANKIFPNSLNPLAQSKPGSGHDNFLKGIIVQFNLCISEKAWPEAQRYNWLDFVSSCSTMHRITKLNIRQCCNKYVWDSTIRHLESKINLYNSFTKEQKNSGTGKELYLEILYNIPMGFELVARMTTNYLQLKTIYRQRRQHRLPDWHMVCDWIEKLPHSEWITGKE